MGDMIWRPYGIDTPLEEYRFHHIRKWRIDYAWPEKMVAVEIEGAVWAQGRHTRGSGFVKDMEKYNHAALLGWRIFRFTPQQLKKGEAQAFMAEVLNGDGSLK